MKKTFYLGAMWPRSRPSLGAMWPLSKPNPGLT